MTIELAMLNRLLGVVGLLLIVEWSGDHQEDGSFRFDGGPTKIHLTTLRSAIKQGLIIVRD